MTPTFVRTPDERFRALADWPFEARYVEIEGLRMHYVDEGLTDADVVLLTHGEPSWSYLYRHWIPRLVDAGYRVIAHDHIGFGRSDKVTDEAWYTIDRHVENQRQFLHALDLQNISVFVQDWGGPITLRNLCDEPERFRRLFIGNTWLHHDGYEYSDGIHWWRQMALDPEQFGGDMPAGAIVAGSLQRHGHDLDAVRTAYDAPFVDEPSKAGARRFPVCLPFAEPELGGAAWQQRCYQQLPTLGLPVHFVWSDADMVFPWDGAERWAACFENATLDRISGAGHFLQEDAPDDCVEAVLAHL